MVRRYTHCRLVFVTGCQFNLDNPDPLLLLLLLLLLLPVTLWQPQCHCAQHSG